MRRVVVTGLGAITPIGLNVDEFWNGIKESKLGFAEITKFDASEYKAHLAAEVKGFVGKEYMDFKAAKRMELFSQYAVELQEKLWKMQDWIWQRKTRIVWVQRLAPVLEAYRQSSVNIQNL